MDELHYSYIVYTLDALRKTIIEQDKKTVKLFSYLYNYNVNLEDRINDTYNNIDNNLDNIVKISNIQNDINIIKENILRLNDINNDILNTYKNDINKENNKKRKKIVINLSRIFPKIEIKWPKLGIKKKISNLNNRNINDVFIFNIRCNHILDIENERKQKELEELNRKKEIRDRINKIIKSMNNGH